MNSKFVKAIAASLFATFAMTGCIADPTTELDADPNADIDDEQENVDTIDAPVNGGASATSSCYDPIVAKPSSVKTSWNDTHVFTRYLKIEKYNMHVVGTASVSNWMMRETCLFNEAMVSALRDPAKRAKMSGFIAHIGTFKDPPRDDEGHRSGGGNMVSLVCEDMVCGVSKTDPYFPARPKVYRDWVVALHETGHAIEHTLGLEDSSDQVYKQILQNAYKPQNGREYIAWGTEHWFGGSEKRSAMPLLERIYFRTSIFDNQNKWQPKCTR